MPLAAGWARGSSHCAACKNTAPDRMWWSPVAKEQRRQNIVVFPKEIKHIWDTQLNLNSRSAGRCWVVASPGTGGQASQPGASLCFQRSVAHESLAQMRQTGKCHLQSRHSRRTIKCSALQNKKKYCGLLRVNDSFTIKRKDAGCQTFFLLPSLITRMCFKANQKRIKSTYEHTGLNGFI